MLEEFLTNQIHTAVREGIVAAVEDISKRPLVLSADEAAELMSVSRRTVEMWVADGVLPRMPHTGRLLIPRPAIEAWVDDTVQRAR